MAKKATRPVKKSSKVLEKWIAPLLIGMLLVVGLAIALILASLNQDNRQQAAVAAPPTPMKFCHTRTAPCQTLSIPTTQSCPSSAPESGACPTTSATCSSWGQWGSCGSLGNCVNGFQVGTQTRSCATPGVSATQTQSCTVGCGSTGPTLPTCNNSTTNIQQDCKYKSQGATCLNNTGKCQVKNGYGDCSCKLNTVAEGTLPNGPLHCTFTAHTKVDDPATGLYREVSTSYVYYPGKRYCFTPASPSSTTTSCWVCNGWTTQMEYLNSCAVNTCADMGHASLGISYPPGWQPKPTPFMTNK